MSLLENKLSEKQYNEIANITDQILRLNLSNKTVVAQTFLHVLRYSSSFSYYYEEIYQKKISRLNTFSLQFIKNIFIFIKTIFASLFYEKLKLSKHNSAIDFLFVSHYTGESKNQKNVDSYFGEVLKKINLHKFKVVVIYINHTNNKIIKLPFYDKVDSYVLPDSINFTYLLKLFFKSFSAVFMFKSLSGTEISRRMSAKVRFEMLSPGSIQAQIISRHISKIVKFFSPKCLITTYEGHSWERLCFFSARQEIPSIKCIAYQHAPIFKHQHSIIRGIGGNYDPEIVLASGIVSQKLLLSSESLKKSKIFLLGSSRYLLKNYTKNRVKQFSKKTCLVAPEGTVAECKILFSFALECANKMNDIDFLWRFPPQIDIQILRESNTFYNFLANNIYISNSDIEQDFRQSHYILYRGTSLVINAVLFGLKPICLTRKNELTMDPLFLCEEKARRVRNFNEFQKKIIERKIVSKNLIAHCKSIYTPINISCLENLV